MSLCTAAIHLGCRRLPAGLGLVIAKLAASPNPAATHEAFCFLPGNHGGESLESAIVAVMNIFFAFGACT